MGTFPNQRSQSQNCKTGSVNSGLAENRENFSPLQAVHSNRPTRSSRRHNLCTLDKSTGKENSAQLSESLRDPKISRGLRLSKSSEKRKNAGTVSSYAKRLRNRADNANECSGSNHAGGTSFVSNEGSPKNGRGYGTRSNTYGRHCDGQNNSEMNARANLAVTGTNVEKKASAGCKVNERQRVRKGEKEASAACKDKESHEIPILPLQLELSSTPNGQDNGNLPTDPFLLLQKEYEKVHSKYQKLKARKFEEVDSLYEVQNSRIAAYVKATEAMVEYYKEENSYLRQQIEETNLQELLTRSNLLEKANLDCRNDLLLQQSMNFELQQEIKSLKLHPLERTAASNLCTQGAPTLSKEGHIAISVENKEEASVVSSSHSKLMQQLLESLLGLNLCFSSDGVTNQLQFHHSLSGFSFNLRSIHDADIAQLVGGGELMYQNVSLGTLCKKAKDWMKEEEAIFGVAQVQLFLKKLLQFFHQGA